MKLCLVLWMCRWKTSKSTGNGPWTLCRSWWRADRQWAAWSAPPQVHCCSCTIGFFESSKLFYSSVLICELHVVSLLGAVRIIKEVLIYSVCIRLEPAITCAGDSASPAHYLTLQLPHVLHRLQSWYRPRASYADQTSRNTWPPWKRRSAQEAGW